MSRDGFILAMYDIHMSTKKERKEYNKFHRKLEGYGFLMLQESIYYKYLRNIDDSNIIINKIKLQIPKGSNVDFLVLTSNQFSKMNINKNNENIKNISSNILII